VSNDIINKGSFLRGQRLFPQDPQALSVELDRSYVDIAAKVNDKTIGFFPADRPALTGEKWAIAGVTYSGFRQIYPFSAYGSIALNLNTEFIKSFTRIYGVLVSGNTWYPLPYVDTVLVTNQVSVRVTTTHIILTGGAGAPATPSGYVVLEWIGQS
jgi:hypothetical protein